MPVAWEDVENAASRMFNIWTSDGDLAFAKEAWAHLEAAGLTDDLCIVEETRANLRLLALRIIYGEFCQAKWDEDLDIQISYLAENLEIDRLALGLLVAQEMVEGDWRDLDDFDLFEQALTVGVDMIRDEVAECLKTAYGGTTALYLRLSKTRSNDDDMDNDQNGDLDAIEPNLAAYDYLKEIGKD